MKEIGGYFELECGHAPQYHPDAYRLCSGSAGLRLVIRTLRIAKLHVPKYTCPVIWDAIHAENCECLFYETGHDFFPADNFPHEDYILYNNYFGICSGQTEAMCRQYPNVIVDNAQSFYMPHCGIASLYSPHKFFGVPDGGFLSCDFDIKMPEQRAISWQKCSHLLKRHDLGANAGYGDFTKLGAMIREDGVARMSLLTEALLGNVDYTGCRQKRLENFRCLQQHLRGVNRLKIQLQPDDVPMVYPLQGPFPGLREHLIKNKIYVATYWPGVMDHQDLTQIIPLPIDQRYGTQEMAYIADMVKKYVQE